MTRQLKHRLLSGSLGSLGVIFSIYYSNTSFFKPLFILLNAGIISVALVEYYHLAQHKGFRPLISFGITSSVAYTTTLAMSIHHPSLGSLPSLVLLGAFLILFLLFLGQHVFSLGNLAITLFGIAYLTLPLSCALRINDFFPSHALEDGRVWLIYVLLTSKITDVGAYFCGKIFGKTKLAPTISPQKTVEGATGGVITALLTSLLFTLFATHLAVFNMSLMQSLWIGLTISLLAQLGDLTESILKRDAGVKDSSHLPGLGGILDIVDSLVFTLPFVYLLLEMRLVG